MNQIKNNMDELCSISEDIFEDLTKDDTTFRFMAGATDPYLQKDLYILLYQAANKIYGYASIGLYDVNGKLLMVSDNKEVPETLPLYWGLLKKLSHTSGTVYYKTDPFVNGNTNLLYQIARPLLDNQGAVAGYIVLNFNRDSFEHLLNNDAIVTDSLMILDSLSEPIYTSHPLTGQSDILSMLDSGRGQNHAERYVYQSYQSSQYHYAVLLQKQAQISKASIHMMYLITMVITLLCLFSCFAVSLFFSYNISKPIHHLDQAMKQVRAGDLNIRMHTNRKGELGRLSESFNYMVAELDQYIKSAITRQKNLDETMLKLYQTQLNPHFLYNTLDSIKWLSKVNQSYEITTLAENLAVILRHSISSQPFVTLRQELEIIRFYVEIQTIRFSGQFVFAEEIPKSIYDCLLPKMILQPLVENCILHGLEGYENGYICIYAEIQKGGEADILSVSVMDDGSGINADMLDWLNQKDAVKKRGHLGLYNVIQILKLYYADNYDIHANNLKEGGAVVTIHIPVRRR
ncbi:MAG: cache domain-containing sensor histidine kinase [Lachnospiraceae bacterium]